MHVSHTEHVAPPQSTSVSSWFRRVSVQVGAWQTPLVHTSLSQSFATEHVSPGVHWAQAPPPQSTSVSDPFCTPSPQDPIWQMPAVHTSLAQSAAMRQVSPSSHDEQLPPQSVSVSSWFRTKSVQVGV